MKFKSRLLEKERLLGCWNSLCSPAVTEIIAGAGYDWILIDMEHAPNEPAAVLAQLHAASAFETEVIVRPPANDPVVIKRVLDLGTMTILVPMIETADEARAAISAAHYPPRGIRGVSSGSRASAYGARPEMLKEASANVCVLLQIESREGLDNLPEILAVDGVDGIFVGPADLAASLGHLGNPGAPDVQAAIDNVVRACKAAGVALGTLAPALKDADCYLSRGFTFVSVSSDVTMLRVSVEERFRHFSSKTSAGAK